MNRDKKRKAESDAGSGSPAVKMPERGGSEEGSHLNETGVSAVKC